MVICVSFTSVVMSLIFFDLGYATPRKLKKEFTNLIYFKNKLVPNFFLILVGFIRTFKQMSQKSL